MKANWEEDLFFLIAVNLSVYYYLYKIYTVYKYLICFTYLFIYVSRFGTRQLMYLPTFWKFCFNSKTNSFDILRLSYCERSN